MRRCVVHQLVVVVLVLGWCFSGLLSKGISAVDNNVDATLTCSFLSGSQLTVQVQMIVNSIEVFETRYTKQEIEDMATTNQYVMGAIMLRLHDAVKTQVESAFTGATVDSMNMIPTYEKPYFIDMFRVNLTPAFFGYNGSLNLTDFINGVLDMGAVVNYNCDLRAESGWNTTYVYLLPSTMALVYANTAVIDPDTNVLRWVVRNWDGTTEGTTAIISLQSKAPTTALTEAEEINLEYIIDTTTVTNINLINSVIVKKVDIRPYNVLPAFVTGLQSIPADGLRLFIANGLLTWNDLFEHTIHPIEQQTTPIIQNSSFQQNLSLLFHWDPETTVNCSTPYNISHMDDAPVIRAMYQDSEISLRICQMSARAFFGLINAGANVSISSGDMNFGGDLGGLMYPYTLILRLPANITLANQTSYVWNRSTTLSGMVTSELQPTPAYTAEHIETLITIELLKMDLNIPSVFTGKTELTASVKVKEDDNLYVIQRSEALGFSPKVVLSYLNADAFRLCTEENVFGQDQINEFLSVKTSQFQQRVSAVFKGLEIRGAIDRAAFTNSLAWDGDISTMDDVVPVTVTNIANEVQMIGFNVSIWPAELSVAPQQFMLDSIANQTVTYRIIFPRGITINASEDSGRPLIMGKTNDGRDYVELSFDQMNESQSTLLACVMYTSPVYVLGLFLPCILVFLLLVVLIIILYLIRKKRGGFRRGKRKLFEPEDAEPSDYSEQEYYVPPPPSSRKKK